MAENMTITSSEGTFTLIIPPFVTNRRGAAVFEAPALKDTDTADDFGTIPVWALVWTIPETADMEDFDPAVDVDWENPEVEPYGGSCNQGHYQISTGRII